MSKTLSRNPYFNCRVVDINGDFLFYSSEKKMNWYLRKGLATKLGPKLIQITFQTKGNGHRGDPFYEQERKNICAVCGCSDNLTAHHIVPYCFRRFMNETKSHNHYDVIPMCIDCHEKYEKHAEDLKKKLCKEFEVPKDGIDARTNMSKNHTNKLFGLCSSLVQYGHLIPDDRQKKIKKKINRILGRAASEQDIQMFFDMQNTPEQNITYSSIIMGKIDDHNQFARIWRKHFIKTMSPQFMPDYWNAESDLKIIRT